jgi:hypothetical protein
MKTAIGILIVVAHVALFGALAHDGVDLSVELPGGRVPPTLAPRVEIHREPGPLARTRWSVRYRGGFVREVGATELVGPFQQPGACVGRVVVGQQLLDASIAPVVGKLIDDELRGENVFPVGDYRRLDKLALRWAQLSAHPDDKPMVGDAPHGYVRVSARVVFDRVDVPIVVALVPDGAGVQFRVAARAELDFDNRVVQWVSDKIGGDKLASQLARRQIDNVLVTTLAPPPPFDTGDHQQLQFTYCTGSIEITEGAYGALPFAVAFSGTPVHVDAPMPAPTSASLSIDLAPDALNAMLHELWRTGWLDRRLAEAGLDRRFNTDPIVSEYLSVRISPARLALPPVVTPAPGGDKLHLAADARITITDGTKATVGHVFGALDLGFPYSVDVGGVELACEQSPTTLVPCYGDLVAALRDRGPEFHGALTDAFTHLIDQIFVERHLDGLPADVVIHGARATLTGGTLHLELDAAVH